jgi:hypothetical protein
MKTIEHVLAPRLSNQTSGNNSSDSAEMSEMLKKTRDRIVVIEAELRDRRNVKEQEELY